MLNVQQINITMKIIKNQMTVYNMNYWIKWSVINDKTYH